MAMKSSKKSKMHRRASPQTYKRSHKLDARSSIASTDASVHSRTSGSDGSCSSDEWCGTTKSRSSLQKKMPHSKQRETLRESSFREKQHTRMEEDESSSDEDSSTDEDLQAVKVRHQAQETPRAEKLNSLKRPKSSKGCTNKNVGSTLASKTNTYRDEFLQKVTSPSQLKWHTTRLRRNNNAQDSMSLRPCRILGTEEKYNVDNLPGHSLVQFLVYPNTASGEYRSVVDDSLFPFHANGTMTLDEDCLAQYVQQQQRRTNNRDVVETERVYLIDLFEHAVRIEKESRENEPKELKDHYHANDLMDEKRRVSKRPRTSFEFQGTSEDEEDVLETPRPLLEIEEHTEKECIDDEFLDAPYTQAINFDPDSNNLDDGISNEPIRPGDVIEYYSPIFVVGDKRGLRQATVLCVDPKADVILGLSNGECLPEETRVKRIKVMDGNELVDHPGIYRPIETFKLVAANAKGYSAGDGIRNEAARFGDIFRKNVDKMKAAAEAEGFAPMDMILNLSGGRRANAQDVSGKPNALGKKMANLTPRSKHIRPPLSPSSSSESGTNETSTFARASKQSPRSSKRPTIPPKSDKQDIDQTLHPSSSSSCSDGDFDQTLSELKREKYALNRVSLVTSPEKIPYTSRNTDKENVDNSYAGKNHIFGNASSPDSLGISLASSPASLGPSLASSPASLGTSLASSSSDDRDGLSSAKCSKVLNARASPGAMDSNEQLKVGPEALHLSADLSSESSANGSTKKVGKQKKRGLSSIHALSDDDISDTDEDKPHLKGEPTNSFKSSRKSLQSQSSSLSGITTGGWTRGKSGWVKAADAPCFLLSFSRHK